MYGIPFGIRSSRGSAATAAGAVGEVAAASVMGGAHTTTRPRTGGEHTTTLRHVMDRDARELARFGYAQELLRGLGGFSTFAIGFSVISVLTGITSTFGDALASGGPAGLGLGWPLGSAGTLLVAVAMAELASAFPTAGALYHWSALLGGPAWGWA